VSPLPPIPCDALVLDMDGVLIDSEDVNVASAFEAFEALGVPLDPEDRPAIVGKHPDDYVPDLAARRGLPATRVAELAAVQSRAYARLWASRAVLIPGVPETLAELAGRGFRLGLATSAGRSHASAALTRFGLERRFEFALTKDDVARRKPDPEIYRLALERLDLPVGAVVVVEDSGYGVAAANAAGLACIAVRTRHTPFERIARAERVVDAITDLPGTVVRRDP